MFLFRHFCLILKQKNINITTYITIDMVTTIAVKEITLQLLTQIKKKIGADSLDETIVKVMQKAEDIPTTRFGSQPNLKSFSESERASFHDL